MSAVRRFTLIELLVVITIIAVLTSLLLPALAGAKRRALDMDCAGTQKQVVLALIMFADDHDGKTPSMRTSWQAVQLESMDTYGGSFNGPDHDIWQGHAGRFRDIVREGYVPVTAMRCPANDQWQLTGILEMTTHPFSGGLTGQWIYWGTGLQWKPEPTGPSKDYFNRIENYTSDWPLLMDHLIPEGHPRSNNWNQGRANHDPRSCRGGNITFVDGHRSWVDLADTVHVAPHNGTNGATQVPIGPNGMPIPVIVYNSTEDRMQYNMGSNSYQASAAVMSIYAASVPADSVQ